MEGCPPNRTDLYLTRTIKIHDQPTVSKSERQNIFRKTVSSCKLKILLYNSNLEFTRWHCFSEYVLSFTLRTINFFKYVKTIYFEKNMRYPKKIHEGEILGKILGHYCLCYIISISWCHELPYSEYCRKNKIILYCQRFPVVQEISKIMRDIWGISDVKWKFLQLIIVNYESIEPNIKFSLG